VYVITLSCKMCVTLTYVLLYGYIYYTYLEWIVLVRMLTNWDTFESVQT